MAITALFGAAKIGMGMKSFISGGAKLGSSVLGAAKIGKSLISGGTKLGSSVLGAAKNTAVGVKKTAQAMVPQKMEGNENRFIKNYTNFFGSEKTEKILRKNLKLVRDSLVNTFEIARHLKAAIVDITKGLKGGGKGGGLFGGLGGMFGMIGGITGIIGGLVGLLTNPFVLSFLGIVAAGGITALLLNEDFRNKLVEIIKPIVTFLWRSELSPRVNKDKMDDPLQMTAQMRQNIGDERTLAVLKGRLAELEENKPGWWSQDRIGWNALTKGIKDEIEFLEDQDIETGEMSGEQFEKDLAMFTKEQEMRSKIQDIKGFEESSIVVGVNHGSDKVIGDALGIPSEEVTNKHRAKLRRSLMSEIDKRYDAILKYWYKNGKLPDGVSLEKGFRVLEKDIAGIKAESLGSTRKEIIANEVKKVFAAGKKPEVTSENTSQNKNIEGVKSGETKASVTSENTSQNQNVEGVKSEVTGMNFENFYNDGSLDETKFNFEPITFDFSGPQAQNSSGGDVTNTSSGSSPSGNAVTFFSSSNSDPTYHKLNALMTFNII